MQNYKVGIVGAGTMGKQIALLCASRGIQVIVWNHHRQATFDKDFTRLALIQSKLGYISKEALGSISESVRYTNDINLMAGCNILIEAVKEDKEIKSSVLRKLDPIIAIDEKIVATNTSTLSITELASITRNPARFLGMHFFNPPMAMKLVEVIKGELTSEEAVLAATEFLSVLDKTPIVLPETLPH